MTGSLVPMIVPPIILYAETHYRFPYFGSYLRKDEPEVIADAPLRVEPGRHLPVLLLVKDAHLFPCTLLRVTASLRTADSTVSRRELFSGELPCTGQFWWKVFHIDVTTVRGPLLCDVEFEIDVRGRRQIYRNDNHRTSSHAPLRVFLADEPLPRLPGLQLGEPHAHSQFTNDQVEFGIPGEPARQLAFAMGLSYFCLTDHSYDLDDHIEDYLRNHPDVPKWSLFQREVDTLNAGQHEVTVVRGEEVTCRNARGRNIHLLLLGNRTFYPGSGDGAERWLRTWSEHDIPGILRQLDPGVAAFAAHARERVSILQRLLLGRGIWTEEDLHRARLQGLQFANGKRDEAFDDGYRTWIKLLLQGHRVLSIAGDDAHGNFNRFRQIGIPFLRIRENSQQLFGLMRTGVFTDKTAEGEIVDALRRGVSILTDGPVLNLQAGSTVNPLSALGTTLAGRTQTVLFSGATSREFGPFQSVRLLMGVTGEEKERELPVRDSSYPSRFEERIPIAVDRPCYLRAEAFTGQRNEADHFCYTNPVWLTPG